MPDSKNKKNAKVLIKALVAGFFVFIVLVGIVFYILNRSQGIDYTYVSVPKLPSAYDAGSELRLRNSIAIKKEDLKHENSYYAAPGLDINKLRTGVQKLGLSNERFRQTSGVYLWYKEDEEFADNVTYTAGLGRLHITYKNGVNSTPIQTADSYRFLSEFFGISDYGIYLLKLTKNGNHETAYFGLKLNDRQVYFNQATDIAGTVNLRDGKITNAILYVVPVQNEVVKQEQVKPLEEITPVIFETANFSMEVFPESVLSLERTGYIATPPKTVDVNMNDYVLAYYYYIDSTGRFVFMPAIDVRGRYLDDQNRPGTIKIVIINQSREY